MGNRRLFAIIFQIFVLTIVLFTQIVNKHLDLTTENYLRRLAAGYSENSGPEILLVAHIYGPLCMLAVGLSLALISFCAEHIYFYIQIINGLKHK